MRGSAFFSMPSQSKTREQTATPTAGKNRRPGLRLGRQFFRTCYPGHTPRRNCWPIYPYRHGGSGRPLACTLSSTSKLGRIERSEEHTSELQSLRHLVCRLLLEKKNTNH